MERGDVDAELAATMDKEFKALLQATAGHGEAEGAALCYAQAGTGMAEPAEIYPRGF